MLKTVIYTLTLSLFLSILVTGSPAAFAQGNIGPSILDTDENAVTFDEPRDSFYYLKDDGKFTDAEKDEEALYIYQSCNNNAIQKQLFDCSCIAGSFRNERDAEKLIPQGHILSGLYAKQDSPCANIAMIAGDTYEKCMKTEKIYNQENTETQNTRYCSCLANRTASNYGRAPKLSLNYFSTIKLKSAKTCRAIYRRQ